MDLIQIKEEFRVDSRLLATSLDHRHRTILESIDKYSEQLKSISELPFKTESGLPRPQGGTSTIRYAILSEDQCYFILTLMRNNDRVVDLKLKLVKAFRDARKQLAERDIARIEGKRIRRDETDAIKALVEYATASGSKNANFYYANITKMTNSILGIESGQRDKLDKRQLDIISVIELTVRLAIGDGLRAELEYKQIYALCKDRVSSLSTALALR